MNQYRDKFNELRNHKRPCFEDYQNEQIHLSFSQQSNDQQTLNLKTEEIGCHSFFTDPSNIFEQRVGYYNGQLSDAYDYYIISKQDLIKLMPQLKPPRPTVRASAFQSQIMEEGCPQHMKDVSLVVKKQADKENQRYNSYQKLNQPLPSRQRSQTLLSKLKY